MDSNYEDQDGPGWWIMALLGISMVLGIGDAVDGRLSAIATGAPK